MNAIRFWGLVAVFLAPALAQQTYFPDQGNFTFEQTSVGDWLEIQYSYTNPGGWQRDDAGAEVDWNLLDDPYRGVYSNCSGQHSHRNNGGYVDCGILATPEPGDKGHAWGGGLRYANSIVAGTWYEMNITLWEGLGYNDGKSYPWNLVGQETKPCSGGPNCTNICPNNNPICMFSARSKLIISQDTHPPVQIPKPGVLMKSWSCKPGSDNDPENWTCTNR